MRRSCACNATAQSVLLQVCCLFERLRQSKQWHRPTASPAALLQTICPAAPAVRSTFSPPNAAASAESCATGRTLLSLSLPDPAASSCVRECAHRGHRVQAAHYSFNTATAGSISRRLRSSRMVTKRFQTSVVVWKWSRRSPSLWTTLTVFQFCSSRRLMPRLQRATLRVSSGQQRVSEKKR